MTITGRLRSAFRALVGPEQRVLTRDQFDALGLLEPASYSGIAVSPSTALTLPAYFRCVDTISSNAAGLPKVMYQRVGDEDRQKAVTQPGYKVLQQPNPFATSFSLWQAIIAHALTWGNGYAEIEFDRSFRPIALWPIPPDAIEPRVDMVTRKDRTTVADVWYLYKPTQTRLEAEDVIHIPGLGWDGIQGYSVAQLARESIGLGLAVGRYGSAFFGEGSWFGSVLEHPGTMDEDAQERWRSSIEKRHQGAGRAHRLMVLENGMKVSKVGIPNDDAQFLGTQEFNVLDMARWFNLPPHKLMHKVGERPGGNFEASQIEFLTETLRPWLIRIEQECNRKLVSPSQQGVYYVEHLVDSILRTDVSTRWATYKIASDLGVLTAEQIAAKENLPKPKPPPKVKPAPAADAPPEDTPPPPQQNGQRAILVELVGRFVRKEAAAAKRASRKGPDAFERWLFEFYGEERAEFEALVQLAAGDRAHGLVSRYFERSVAAFAKVTVSDLERQVDALVTRWETQRAVELAEAIMEEPHAA